MWIGMRGIISRFRATIARSTSAPAVERKNVMPSGENSSMISLTSRNELPHVSATARNAASHEVGERFIK
jgi:hypothetical protein